MQYRAVYLLLLICGLAVLQSIANGELSLEEISVLVHRQQAAAINSGGTHSAATVSHRFNDTQVTEHLLQEVDKLSLRIHTALNNDTTNCSIALKALSNDTQVMKFSPSFNVTVHKETIALDACGKPVPEILKGNFQFRGGYDECMSLDTSRYNFSMQYSDVGIIFVYVTLTDEPLIFPIPMMESLCIPDVCSAMDVNASLTRINKDMLALPIPEKVLMFVDGFNTQASQSDIPRRYSAGAIVMMVVCFLFVFLSALGTMYDLFQPYYTAAGLKTYACVNEVSVEESAAEKSSLLVQAEHPEILKSRWKQFAEDACRSFSLYNTVPAVMSTTQPKSAITSINGIRVISMFWVILGHTYLFLLPFNAYKNQVDIFQNFIPRFTAQPIGNAYFAVDSFFFLSGFLVSYLTLREMNRNKGRFPFVSFYVHRILRLTPTYMFTLFFYWYLAVHLTDGPGLNAALGENSDSYKNCEKYWWTNLLYINNFYPVKFGKQCMGWTWYLANDMQFYIISPLFLIPLFLSLTSGLVALGTTLIASIGVTGFVAGYYGYWANTLYETVSSNDPLDPHLPDQSSEIYGKPYCRIAPYIVGIFLGYVLFKKYRIALGNTFNLITYSLMWIVAAITGIANVYGLYFSFHGHEFSAAENVIYFMFSRFGWGVTLFMVVYACHHGYGGVVNRFLSLPMWVPLGRLTFTTYLIHEIILLLIAGQLRDGLYFTDLMMVVHVIANTVLSFGAAAVITVFVEFPLSNLERAVFKLFGKPLRSTVRASGTGDNN